MKRKIIRVWIALCVVVCLGTPLCSNAIVKKPSISNRKITLTVGDKVTLRMKNSKKKVTWKSSNKKVATVSPKGVVKAKKKGRATITAVIAKKKYTCKVVVKAKSKKTAQNQVDEKAFESTDATERSNSAASTEKSASNSVASQTTAAKKDASTADSTSKTTASSPNVMDPETKDDGWSPGWY